MNITHLGKETLLVGGGARDPQPLLLLGVKGR